jgi:HPr kinase/phosphorylase
MPAARQPITVEEFFRQHGGELGLRLLAGEKGLKRAIHEPTVNRPGLALAGVLRFFARFRIQVIGSAEAAYLRSLPAADRPASWRILFSRRVPAVVWGRGLKPDSAFLREADRARVPVFNTPLITMKFINRATLALEAVFAPRGTELGSMVDLHGVGVIIRGESGIGKSECVLSLLERGYSLVADDVVKVRLHDGREVMGAAAAPLRHLMEVRGIGIIDVGAMFGVKAVREEKRVDLLVTLKTWADVPDVDRLGLDQHHVEVLGVKIPHITLPIRPGRDVARLVEVAALQVKLREYGHNAAVELGRRLQAKMRDGAAPAAPVPAVGRGE